MLASVKDMDVLWNSPQSGGLDEVLVRRHLEKIGDRLVIQSRYRLGDLSGGRCQHWAEPQDRSDKMQYGASHETLCACHTIITSQS